MTDMSGERRRYFRIDDHVRLNYKVISDLKHLPGHDTDEVILPNEVLLKDLEASSTTSSTPCGRNTRWRRKRSPS